MSQIGQTVADFGRSLGMDELELRPSGGVVLSLENIGTLAFDTAGRNGEDVVISLARPIARPADISWQKILARSHYSAHPAVPFHVGTWRDQLIFAVLLPAGEFTLPRLHEAIRTLDQEHRSVEATL